jgi:hypothetical protein
MTQDYKLPPLPPGYKSYEFPDGGYDGDEMQDYAREAIKPYEKRIAELEERIEADRKRRGEPTAAEISDVIREITGCPDIKNGEDSLVVALGMLFHRCATTQSAEPVAWQWLDTAHFRKKIPSHSNAAEWRPLFVGRP